MASQEIREIERTIPFQLNGNANLDGGMAFSVLQWIGAVGSYCPPYWSTARDIWLRNFYLRSDYLKIATRTFVEKTTGVPLTIAARDYSVKAHVAMAAEIESNITRNSGFLRGFSNEFNKFVADWCTQDNGAFMLIMGPGKADGPITGQVSGVVHLDSQRCTRTGHPEFPVVYAHTDGRRYRLHYTRVILMSSIPSANADLFDVGVCAVSACIGSAQDMLDIATYNQEKLGGRPARQILYAKTGASVKQLSDATLLANVKMDAQGLDRFSRTMLLAPSSPTGQLELDMIDLASAPDGFNREMATILDVAVIAAAYGLDMRDLSHSFGVAGQTKADAEAMDKKTKAKGVATFLDNFAEQLNQKVLPEAIEAYFDYVDDTQDEQAAEIRKLRAEGRTIDLTSGVMTVRTTREQMLADEEITDNQFEDMELADGRLADGLDVLMLFQSQDREIRSILMDIDPALAVDAALVEERRRMAWLRHDSAPNANIKRKMRRALAALAKLQATTQQVATEPATPPEIETDEEQPAEDEEPEFKAIHTKQDDDLDELMADYDDQLTGLVDSARTGQTSQDSFEEEMAAVVAAMLLAAFLRGSRLSEVELTDAMRERFGEELEINLESIGGFADDIYDGKYSAENLGEEGAGFRTALWVGALARVYAQGQVSRKGNPRYRWNLGATERHCSTCSSLAGQVKTAADWLTEGYLPRGSNLECRGYRCDCSFSEVSA
jgi:hypothetical protein